MCNLESSRGSNSVINDVGTMENESECVDRESVQDKLSADGFEGEPAFNEFVAGVKLEHI